MKHAATAIAAALIFAPLAHADDLVGEYGHRICDAQANFWPLPRMAAQAAIQNELAARGLSNPQMLDLKKQAILAYCPDLRWR